MRCVIVAVLAAILLCGVAGAATVTGLCTLFPVTFTAGAGSTTVSCPSFADAYGAPAPGGTYLAGATLHFLADYQAGGVTGANQVTVTFAPGGSPAGVTWTNSSQAIQVAGGYTSLTTTPVGADGIPGILDPAIAGVSYANFAAAFSFGVSSILDLGSVGTSAGNAYIVYDYESTTPEPSTVALMGGGLIALAGFARRFRRG